MTTALMVPDDPPAGHRFDRHKILLDPYGKSISVGQHYSRSAACKPGDNAATSMKSVVTDLSTFDWEGDRPHNRPFLRTVIYEMPVQGYPHPNSEVTPDKRGTDLGVVEKIPYLQELGITVVELMPVFQFDRAGRIAKVVEEFAGREPKSVLNTPQKPRPALRE